MEAGSGDDRYWLAGEVRVAGEIPDGGSSASIIEARLLRGGEYGGGAGTTTVDLSDLCLAEQIPTESINERT